MRKLEKYEKKKSKYNGFKSPSQIKFIAYIHLKLNPMIINLT